MTLSVCGCAADKTYVNDFHIVSAFISNGGVKGCLLCGKRLSFRR